MSYYFTREMSALAPLRNTGPMRLPPTRRALPVVKLTTGRKPSPVFKVTRKPLQVARLSPRDLDSQIDAAGERTKRLLSADDIPGACAASDEFRRLWAEKLRRQGR